MTMTGSRTAEVSSAGSTKDRPNGVAQGASSPPPVLKSAYKHMNINIDALSDTKVTMNEMSTTDNIDGLVAIDVIKNPSVSGSDGESDSDMDWQQLPATPSTGSESSVNADESVTMIQEPSQSASWVDHVGSNDSTDVTDNNGDDGDDGDDGNGGIWATDYRTAHQTLFPEPLNPIGLLQPLNDSLYLNAARPIPVSAESLFMNKYERFWHELHKREDKEHEEAARGLENGGHDAPSSASHISRSSDATLMPRHGHSDNIPRDGPRESLGKPHRESLHQTAPLSVVSRCTPPYPAPYLASTPANPFASNRSYTDETTPLFSPRDASANPFASRPLSRRPESYYFDYEPLEPLEQSTGPLPAYYLRSPSPSPASVPAPAPERMLDALHSQEARNAWRQYGMNEDEPVPGSPLPPFSLRVPGIGNGNRVGTHASGSDTITQEHIDNQRQLQKFVGLLSDLLHDEVRNVAKTVLELTNDMYDMRENIIRLRRDMEILKKEHQQSKTSNQAGGSNTKTNGNINSHPIPMRPFSTHYYPNAFSPKPPPTYSNSPRLPGNDTLGGWRVPHSRICEPIREHSTVGSLVDDEPRNDWGMSGPQSIHDYMGTHDFGRDSGRDRYRDRDGYIHPAMAQVMDDEAYNDDRNIRNIRNSRSSRYGFDARDVRDSRDSETLPPYTYRHDDPSPRSLHPVFSNGSRNTEEGSLFDCRY